MTLWDVKQSYKNEKLKIWNKLMDCPCPVESKQLSKSYDNICNDYKEFLEQNNLYDDED